MWWRRRLISSHWSRLFLTASLFLVLHQTLLGRLGHDAILFFLVPWLLFLNLWQNSQEKLFLYLVTSGCTKHFYHGFFSDLGALLVLVKCPDRVVIIIILLWQVSSMVWLYDFWPLVEEKEPLVTCQESVYQQIQLESVIDKSPYIKAFLKNSLCGPLCLHFSISLTKVASVA